MRRWSYLSLRRRILLCAAVVLMLLAFLWALLGYPALTDEGYLRRAERAHLLPAGDILTKIKTSPRDNESEFLAADGGKYLELFWLPTSHLWSASGEGFYLYEKQGDLTAVPLPTCTSVPSLNGGYALTGCMILFDERPEIQRVELSFTVGDEAAVYTSQAEREVGGLFVCYHGGPQLRDLWADPTLAKCSAKLYAADGSLLEVTEVPMGRLIY